MNYIAAIDAFEQLHAPEQTHGVMLNGKTTLDNMNRQRLLIQSLLLAPPTQQSDVRLQQLQQIEADSWLKKISNCGQKQLCIRLPDSSIEAFLPGTPAELEQLSTYMSCPDAWLQEHVHAVRKSNPDLGCYLIISNDILFGTILRGLFSAAQKCGVEKMSILLPFVNRCREVQQQNMFVAQCAVDYDITCDVGVEIATPRSIRFASELAVHADVIVFNVDELCWLLYGKAPEQTSSHHHEYGFHETPFNEFDDIGIGTLLGVAVQQIRQNKPGIRLCASGKYVLTEKGKNFCRELGIHSLIAATHLFPADSQ
ncbi:MAG: hypothetical protein LUE11_12525 [Clostridia bacterium]|nr:hypothetical protein [Clostridia bacterium]